MHQHASAEQVRSSHGLGPAVTGARMPDFAALVNPRSPAGLFYPQIPIKLVFCYKPINKIMGEFAPKNLGRNRWAKVLARIIHFEPQRRGDAEKTRKIGESNFYTLRTRVFT